VQLKAVAGDVTDGLEGRRAKHGLDLGRDNSRVIGQHRQQAVRRAAALQC
jgi:hypothetical protein